MNAKSESIVEILNARRASTTSAVFEVEPAETTASEYSPFALGRVSNRPQMMLLLRKCTGEVTAYAYSLLTKIHTLDSAKGFTLTFGDTRVQIDGENLSQLFQYVCQHKAAEISEAGRTASFRSEPDIQVTEIRIL